MNKIMKSIRGLYILAIIFSLYLTLLIGNQHSICYGILIMQVMGYLVLIYTTVKMLYNRKRLVRERKSLIFTSTVSLFVLNSWWLGLTIWNISVFEPCAFKGVNSFLDAIYFAIVTFSTVGYGDMYPVTALAKIVVIAIIISNFLLLVLFFNIFIMRAQKKKTYIENLICKIVFMFENISSICSICKEELKTEEHTIEEWINIYCDLLQENLDSNQERWKEIDEFNKKIVKENEKNMYTEEFTNIPIRYLNSRDSFLIRELKTSLKDIQEEVEILLHNRIMLVEEEHLTESEIATLSLMRIDLRHGLIDTYSCDIQHSINLIRAWGTVDLIQYLDKLNYPAIKIVKMNGYDAAGKNIALCLALQNINSKEDLKEKNIKDYMDIFFDL